MSDTPRTDAALAMPHGDAVAAHLSATLERELAARTAERNAALADAENAKEERNRIAATVLDRHFAAFCHLAAPWRHLNDYDSRWVADKEAGR